MTDINVPAGLVVWFGEQPRKMGASCPHACGHKWKEVVAWGPTLDMYELVQCRECGCRGWRRPCQAADFKEVL
jgi:hypothetical protein